VEKEKGGFMSNGFMSKTSLLALTLAGLVSVGTISAVAQDNGSNQQSAPSQSAPMGQEGHGHRHFDPEKRTEMLTKQLKLTSDQQPKVLDIFKSEQSQMQSLWSDNSTAQDDRRSKMMEIHKTSNDQVRALLTPDQQKKFDTMQTRHEHMGGGPDNPPPSDSQK
jgi:Spy/CpxP family protein refolding chaperone